MTWIRYWGITMSHIKGIVFAVSACTVLLLIAIGTGFAYTSSTDNSGNSVSSDYLVVTPGDAKYSANFNHYFEYHWGTTISETGISRIYSPCGWFINNITVEGHDIQAYILGEMKLDIISINDLDDFTVSMDVHKEHEIRISESYEYVTIATVIDKSTMEEKTPTVYGYYAKYFSHDDEVEHSRSYGSEFVISTTPGEGKDIVLNDLPLDYDKKEYMVILTLYLVANTLDFQPEGILGIVEGGVRKGVDFEFCVTADDSL